MIFRGLGGLEERDAEGKGGGRSWLSTLGQVRKQAAFKAAEYLSLGQSTVQSLTGSLDLHSTRLDGFLEEKMGVGGWEMTAPSPLDRGRLLSSFPGREQAAFKALEYLSLRYSTVQYLTASSNLHSTQLDGFLEDDVRRETWGMGAHRPSSGLALFPSSGVYNAISNLGNDSDEPRRSL